jgi:hypothetical protein
MISFYKSTHYFNMTTRKVEKHQEKSKEDVFIVEHTLSTYTEIDYLKVKANIHEETTVVRSIKIILADIC